MICPQICTVQPAGHRDIAARPDMPERAAALERPADLRQVSEIGH
jgi:hypothetical protein